MRDRAWSVRLYGEIIDRTGAQTMLYLTCTIISSVDLAHYGVSRAKDWVSVDCGTISVLSNIPFVAHKQLFISDAFIHKMIRKLSVICHK